MYQASKFSSFMISDILKCDKEEQNLQNSVNNQMSLSVDYNLLTSYVNHTNHTNHTNNYSAYSQPQSYYSWDQSFDNNLVSCDRPTADTILWQHYLLRQRMLMQAKPRKGGQIRFTTEQSVTLEKQFDGQKYLSPPERKKIAAQLGLTERQIKTWFQNRRAKWRRCKQFNEDRDGDKSILFNKYKDTHSCSPDHNNEEQSDPYQHRNSTHHSDISVDFRLVNFS